MTNENIRQYVKGLLKTSFLNKKTLNKIDENTIRNINAINTKANASDLTSHTNDTTVHITSTERTDWNNAKTHAASTHAPTNAQANVQADWNETNTTSDAYIQNKPTIPVVTDTYDATSGNAMSGIAVASAISGLSSSGSGGSGSRGCWIGSGHCSHAEGCKTEANGDYSHAEGWRSIASGKSSHAEGGNRDNSGNEIEGFFNLTIDGIDYKIYGSVANGVSSHAEGVQTVSYGYASHSEGYRSIANGDYSHAEGSETKAKGDYSHVEGSGTIASRNYSHAEGYNTTASGTYSHSEGDGSIASGTWSHAEGRGAIASGNSSHAEGGGEASGGHSHAEGSITEASGGSSHAEGGSTKANEACSHSEGYFTEANGAYSHAEGGFTKANGACSHSEGYFTTADNFASHSCGRYNVLMTNNGDFTNVKGTAFVIGNGVSDSELSNAFSVQFDGTVKAANTITASTNADYAEFFEWLDANPDNEDRVGYFVTLDGDKIRIATNEDDYILGVVSGEPFVLGNGDCDVWNGMYLRDEYRRLLREPAPKTVMVEDKEITTEEYTDEETGETKTREVEVVVGHHYEEVEGEYQGERFVLNPEYDSSRAYVSRFDRQEWSPVGMLGVLPVRHDGTAKVNGYVTVNENGIATSCDRNAENSYRVIKSNSENVVEIIFR